MALLIDEAGLVLLKTFCRRLTRHANIQAFQHAIKLWIGGTKPCIFIKHAPR